MLPKPVAASVECGFYFAFRKRVALGDVGYGIQIPIPANENISFLNIQCTEKSVDCFTERNVLYAAQGIIRCRDALLQLCAEFTYKCTAFQATAVATAIQGYVTGNPGQKSI